MAQIELDDGTHAVVRFAAALLRISESGVLALAVERADGS